MYPTISALFFLSLLGKDVCTEPRIQICWFIPLKPLQLYPYIIFVMYSEYVQVNPEKKNESAVSAVLLNLLFYCIYSIGFTYCVWYANNKMLL